MRKLTLVIGVVVLMASSAAAQGQPSAAPAPDPASKYDTVLVSVHDAPGTNQFRVDVWVVNVDPVSGMPTPLKVTSPNAKIMFDSVVYEDGRVDYFQLKVANADTLNQTVLFGLIADLSGSKPPLAPGRGKAFSFYCTADKEIKTADVGIDAVVLPPANKLEFNVMDDVNRQVISVHPTFVHGTWKAESKPKEE
jgi:hypothetical protein